MRFTLTSLEQTQILARCLAHCLESTQAKPAILMQGQLGAGKTTFVHALVLALPGGDRAEVSSPSFNILNVYPTIPEIGHFDLYRHAGLGFDPDLEEILLSPNHFCIVEWAQYLPPGSQPDDFIYLTWTIEGTVRHLDALPQGDGAQTLLDCVHVQWSQACHSP